jgi:hypothetical protein
VSPFILPLYTKKPVMKGDTSGDNLICFLQKHCPNTFFRKSLVAVCISLFLPRACSTIEVSPFLLPLYTKKPVIKGNTSGDNLICFLQKHCPNTFFRKSLVAACISLFLPRACSIIEVSPFLLPLYTKKPVMKGDTFGDNLIFFSQSLAQNIF